MGASDQSAWRDGELIMFSLSQIAARDNISKAAVSKWIKRLLLAHAEAPLERDGQGRVKRVSLAHYDHFRERCAELMTTIDPDRVLKPVAVGAQVEPLESFEEARRQAEWLKVHRERLRKQVDEGNLLSKDSLTAALHSAGQEILSIINHLPNAADQVALAVCQNGSEGAAAELVRLASAINMAIAATLQRVTLINVASSV